jgi:hypothetical protein
MSVATLYNTLPSLDEANEQFINREQVLKTLGPLFAKHGNKFGLCLVHRHCTLEDGEMMVATGNVSEPKRDIKCFPERWLATGQPFEFNRDPTSPPPSELVEEFQTIVKGMSFGGVGVLGLFFVQDKQHVDGIHVERTEGRKNIMEVVPESSSFDIATCIATCWIPVDGSPTPLQAYVCQNNMNDNHAHVTLNDKCVLFPALPCAKQCTDFVIRPPPKFSTVFSVASHE